MDRLESEKRFYNSVFNNNPRKSTRKYYSIAQSSRNYYIAMIKQYGTEKKVLEYGCGPGSCAFILAECNSAVSGIDISETAIANANKVASKKNLNATFKVMNAEELLFDDNSFDLICGSAILHHLQLDKAFPEIARTLKPGGKAVFLEPLGHNFFINLYRKRTPELRTKDEHPLVMNDFLLAQKYFGSIKTKYFHLCSLAAVLFKNFSFFQALTSFLDHIDSTLFSSIPFLKRYAWAVVIEFVKSEALPARQDV
jgi:ubiquinone/menaquinone biosynthesis C-methylase UbiE